MLFRASGVLKIAAMAVLWGAGFAGGGATSASAETFRTQCYDDGCYRVRCDDLGNLCVSVDFGEESDRPDRSPYVCNPEGNDCRWAHARDNDRLYDYPPTVATIETTTMSERPRAAAHRLQRVHRRFINLRPSCPSGHTPRRPAPIPEIRS